MFGSFDKIIKLVTINVYSYSRGVKIFYSLSATLWIDIEDHCECYSEYTTQNNKTPFFFLHVSGLFVTSVSIF